MFYKTLTKLLKNMARRETALNGPILVEDHISWRAAEVIETLEDQRSNLLNALEWSLSKVVFKPHEWTCKENRYAHEAALALVAELEDE